MTKAMKTMEAQKLYKFRWQMVESVSGVIKTNKGLIVFLTSGIKTVRTKLTPASTARNIEQIWDELKDKARCIPQPVSEECRHRKNVGIAAVQNALLVIG